MTRLLYLHGLGSSGQAATAKGLAHEGFTVIAPDYLPEMCRASLAQLSLQVEQAQPDVIVGTSMGGYYALKLAERFAIPVVAVNVCYQPELLLAKYLHEPAMNFQTGQPIIFTAEMLAQFAPLQPSLINAPTIVIGRNDELIPAGYQQQYCQQQGWRYQLTDWQHRVGNYAELAAIVTDALAASRN